MHEDCPDDCCFKLLIDYRHITYIFLSVRSSKLYPRIRWCVSEARTVRPSLRHHRHCTRTPSHESSRFPSRSWGNQRTYSWWKLTWLIMTFGSYVVVLSLLKCDYYFILSRKKMGFLMVVVLTFKDKQLSLGTITVYASRCYCWV